MALGVAYEKLVSRRGWSLRRYHLKPYRKDDNNTRHQRPSQRANGDARRPAIILKNRKETEDGSQEKIVGAYASDASAAWHVMPDKAIGVALQIRGEAAFPLLEPEGGVHEFKTKGAEERCLIEVSGGLLVEYDPPVDINRRSAYRDQPLRRVYDLDERSARDELLNTTFEWSGTVLDSVVTLAIETLWNQRAWAAIEDQT